MRNEDLIRWLLVRFRWAGDHLMRSLILPATLIYTRTEHPPGSPAGEKRIRMVVTWAKAVCAPARLMPDWALQVLEPSAGWAMLADCNSPPLSLPPQHLTGLICPWTGGPVNNRA